MKTDIQLKVNFEVYCSCGSELQFSFIKNENEVSVCAAVAVSPCLICQAEAWDMGYEMGISLMKEKQNG